MKPLVNSDQYTKNKQRKLRACLRNESSSKKAKALRNLRQAEKRIRETFLAAVTARKLYESEKVKDEQRLKQSLDLFAEAEARAEKFLKASNKFQTQNKKPLKAELQGKTKKELAEYLTYTPGLCYPPKEVNPATKTINKNISLIKRKQNDLKNTIFQR